MLKIIQKTSIANNYSQLKEFEAGSWVIVESPNHEELSFLTLTLGLEEGLLTDSVDIDEVPRAEIEDGNLYVFSRFAYTDNSGQIKTSPVMFVIGKNFFVTITLISKSPFRSFALSSDSYNTLEKKSLLLSLIKLSIDSYSVRLNSLSKQVRSVRSNLSIQKVSNKDFIQLVEIGDVLNEFLGDIVPISTVLDYLAINKLNVLKFNEDELDEIEDAALKARQLMDNTKSALKTIVNIREAYSNIATNNLNKKITILTTLTVVLTIPTIVGSFFGMNVSVPFANDKDSFLIIISVTLVLVVTSLLWLKRKGWF
jgi:magnesium transporter